MFWVLFFFFILVTILFIVVALFLPEWVGITGKKALEIQEHQQGETPQSDNESDLKPDHKPDTDTKS